MSALHRLADPLMGYDSVEALAPKERTLRRESVERVSQDSRVCNECCFWCDASEEFKLLCGLDNRILEFEILDRTIHYSL